MQQLNTEMPLKIAVCEDNIEDMQQMQDAIEQSGFAVLTECFDSGENFIKAFHSGVYDIVFLDVYMKGITGVEVAEAIRRADENVVLAFITVSEEHALDGYRLGALKYLVKPPRLSDVQEALTLAEMKRRLRKTATFLVGGKYMEIAIDRILYLEQRDHTIWLFLDNGVMRLSQNMRMKKIAEMLPSPPFIRCHHSYIVNMDYVAGLDRDFLMKNGETVYIRQADIKKCGDIYKAYMLDKVRRD